MWLRVRVRAIFVMNTFISTCVRLLFGIYSSLLPYGWDEGPGKCRVFFFPITLEFPLDETNVRPQRKGIGDYRSDHLPLDKEPHILGKTNTHPQDSTLSEIQMFGPEPAIVYKKNSDESLLI